MIDTFQNIVCINLDRRPDRWRRMQQEFAKHGIRSVHRFAAYDGDAIEKPIHWKHSAGAYGCLLSHLHVVEEARASGASSVLIFEDDTVFDPEFQQKFSEFGKQVPDDWDMLYLGALHKDQPIKLTDNISRITKANSTFAYALRSTVFDAFIDLNRKADNVLDMNSYILQERFNCYCFMPNLAWVQTEYSDVQNKLERHWYLERSLVLFGAEVDRLLSKTSVVIAHHGEPGSKNVTFLKRYYEEYFSPLIEIIVAPTLAAGIAQSDPDRDFLLLTDSDVYFETLDIRANLRMCEEFDGATGFAELIELNHDQAALLRETRITRGIDVTQNHATKNSSNRCCFVNRRALETANRIFHSPNHALLLPRA